MNDQRVDDDNERQRFTSRILPPYMRRSPRVAEVLPLLYLRGLSTGDFREALPAAARQGCGGPESDEHRSADGGLGVGVPAVPAPGYATCLTPPIHNIWGIPPHADHAGLSYRPVGQPPSCSTRRTSLPESLCAAITPQTSARGSRSRLATHAEIAL